MYERPSVALMMTKESPSVEKDDWWELTSMPRSMGPPGVGGGVRLRRVCGVFAPGARWVNGQRLTVT
ncbi:hypothetical protein GCM10010252_56330 [Streptomyces aureoverticillatus]|nr:hypothetical protein GCM10010252_56330 [Streptomyces aureoverticillatus]